jgi:signal peptidase II
VGAVAVVWLVVDQLTKSWAESELRFEDVDVVWTLRLNLAYNTGASFGFGGGYGSWFSLFGIVVVGVLVWQGLRVRSRLAALALGMIVAGVLGNIADRALRGDDGFMSGAVVDFIDLRWWPIFNVADVGIVCGGVLLVVTVLFGGLDDDADDQVGSGGSDEAGPPAPPVPDPAATPPGGERRSGGSAGTTPA